MESDILKIPYVLEVHPLGDNGEIDVLPASGKNLLSSSQLPCGLPPVLPDTNAMLNSFLQDLESLPILHLDAVQKFIPIEPDIQSLFSINLCPLQTTLSVKRNLNTGKLLGFTEEVKDIFEGTHKTSTSLSRAPGPPEAGVKGSSSSFPFWPGGMEEPVVDILKQESLNRSLFEEELLDTPPGFKSGMTFEKKVYDQVDFIHSQPQKIYLSDVLAMDDIPELDLSNEEEERDLEEINLKKMQIEKSENEEIDDPVLKIMQSDIFKIPYDLEVHPLGDNGEIDVLPASGKNLLSSSQLPCGLPPVLPDTNAMLNSFLQDLESLPILHLDAVQKFIPIEPDVQSLFSINLCPLQTTLSVKRNLNTGKLLGFTEEVKDIFEGTHKTSTSLSRAPGPPEAGVKGSSSSFPFWPGGMDEPVVDILKQESLNSSLFEEELLDTPPGFKSGMKFEKKVYDQVDFIHSQPQKIYLSDVLAMDDIPELDLSNEEEERDLEEINLKKMQIEKSENEEIDDPVLKIASLPVLKISEAVPAKPATQYEWAVIEDVKKPVDDFHERIPKMAKTYEFDLDIFQQRAILHLEKKENVFVAAHTSAGKTVVAEYAIALAKKNVTRVIYTSPIKALSNQKFRDFNEEYDDVGLITGDVQKNATASCLIMTTEILRSMLYHGSDVIRELEWVIFDEVHYINDSERGVVWEEVFIMLPDHVNLIMLSATVPNTAEFAEWLGGIKKRKIYVISTQKRPVPLEYHMYTGSVGKTENEMFLILDKNGKFLENKYNEALKAKQDRESKFKATSGPKGPKYNVTISQEKNIYIGLLKHLKKNDLMPTVVFTFSRKRCNTQAAMLKSQDLTTKEEKGRITKFFRHCILKLKEEDQKLPQVLVMGELLERGFGVHHSGILPILKEVVEMLVKDRLVKVLFATETFAMGVNMPARTVVFDSIRKHDGLNFRDLQPSEFIQMAGRAGRRGLDDTGTVILLCKGDVPDIFSLKNMMLGKPTKLVSQFKLTYSMILNLLKIKTFRVEDVMKRSFGESDNQKKKKECQLLLNEAKIELSNTQKPECSLCETDLTEYINSIRKISYLKKEVMNEKCNLAVSRKIFVPGRIIAVSLGVQKNIPGVLLTVDKENKCKVLIVSEKKDPSNTSENVNSAVAPFSKKLFYPHNKKPEVVTVLFQNVEVISNKTIRIYENDIIKEWRRVETVRCDPGHSLTAAFQDLCSFSEANLNGFSSANLNFKDMDIVNKVCTLDNLENSIENFKCVKCPKFSEHFSAFSNYEGLVEAIKQNTFKLSEESLSLHPEYNMRKDVLKSLQYIDDEENVQLKGSVAREMSNHELLITELLVKSVFSDCEPEEVAALLSCMVFQQKCDDDDLELPNQLKEKVKEIKQVALDISQEQFKWGINEPHFVDQYNFHLVNVVYEWAKGTHFANIMQTTEVDEGIIVRSIQRLSELLKDVRNGALLVGDTVLAKKMDDASHVIKRDIVFAASLYTSDSVLSTSK